MSSVLLNSLPFLHSASLDKKVQTIAALLERFPLKAKDVRLEWKVYRKLADFLAEEDHSDYVQLLHAMYEQGIPTNKIARLNEFPQVLVTQFLNNNPETLAD